MAEQTVHSHDCRMAAWLSAHTCKVQLDKNTYSPQVRSLSYHPAKINPTKWSITPACCHPSFSMTALKPALPIIPKTSAQLPSHTPTKQGSHAPCIQRRGILQPPSANGFPNKESAVTEFRLAQTTAHKHKLTQPTVTPTTELLQRLAANAAASVLAGYCCCWYTCCCHCCSSRL